MSRLVLLFLLSAALWAQPDPRAISLQTSAPPAVSGASASIVGTPGLAQIYYWVVAKYPRGSAIPANPVSVRNVPTLSGSNYVQLFWSVPDTGATGYDVLRTSTPSFPSGGCTCLVASVTGVTVSDHGVALSAWAAPVTVTGSRAQLILNARDSDRGGLRANVDGREIAIGSDSGATLPSGCIDGQTFHLIKTSIATLYGCVNGYWSPTATEVNVLKFKGVDPTGATDSRAGIQAAYDYVTAAGGGTVLFPPGRYLVTSYATAVQYSVSVNALDGVERSINTVCAGGAVIQSTLGGSSDYYGIFNFQGALTNSRFDGCKLQSTRPVVPDQNYIVEALNFSGGAPNSIHQFSIVRCTFYNFARAIWGSADIDIDQSQFLFDSRDNCTTTGCTGVYSWPVLGAGPLTWTISNSKFDGFYAYTSLGAAGVAASTSKQPADGFIVGCFRNLTATGNVIRNHGFEGIFVNRCFVQTDLTKFLPGAASITAGAKTLTVTGGSFLSTDVGRPVAVVGAGLTITGDSKPQPLFSSIVAVNSSTQIVLNDPAVVTVASAGFRIDPFPFPVIIAGNIVDSTPIPGESAGNNHRYGIRTDADNSLVQGNTVLNADCGLSTITQQATGSGPADYTFNARNVRFVKNNIYPAGGAYTTSTALLVTSATHPVLDGNIIEFATTPGTAVDAINLAFDYYGSVARNTVRAFSAPLGATNVTAIGTQQSEYMQFSSNDLMGDTCFASRVSAGHHTFEASNTYRCQSLAKNSSANSFLYANTLMRKQQIDWTPATGTKPSSWLRALTSLEWISGEFSWSSYYDNNRTAGSASVVCQGYGAPTFIRERYFFGNGNSGLRTSSDGGVNCYLDWQIPTATTPGPITFTFETTRPGMILSPFPWSRATVGTSSVFTWSGPTLPVSQSVTVKGSSGANCTLTFFDGKLTLSGC